jgi:hypothetical protein
MQETVSTHPAAQIYFAAIQQNISREAAAATSCKHWCAALVTAVFLAMILQQKVLGGMALWALAPAAMLLLLDAHHRARERFWSQAAADFAAKLCRNGKGELRPRELLDLPRPLSGIGEVPKLFSSLGSLAVWPFYAGLGAAAAVINVKTNPAPPVRVLAAVRANSCGSGSCGSAEGCGTGSCGANRGGACSCSGAHATTTSTRTVRPIQAQPGFKQSNLSNGTRPVMTAPGNRPNNGVISNHVPSVPAQADQIIPSGPAPKASPVARPDPEASPPNVILPHASGPESNTRPETGPKAESPATPLPSASTVPNPTSFHATPPVFVG